MKDFLRAWISPQFRPTALRVAVIVGSILFLVNHGNAAMNGKMSRERWLSVFLTYLVPYTVSVHGQFSSHTKTTHTQIIHTQTTRAKLLNTRTR